MRMGDRKWLYYDAVLQLCSLREVVWRADVATGCRGRPRAQLGVSMQGTATQNDLPTDGATYCLIKDRAQWQLPAT